MDVDNVVATDTEARNTVCLTGRLAAAAQTRELPSGAALVTFRVIVDRDATARARSNQRVDSIECVAWLSKVQRSVLRWNAGDRVEVEGAIRRRFYRGPGGAVSRVEVEARSARRAKPG